MKLFGILAALLLLAFSAQAQIAHDLTVYSDDGQKFIMYAQGKQLNESYASNIEIKNIEHDMLRDVRIVFENGDLPPIERKFFQIGNPGTGSETELPVACIYKITLKKGKYKLRFAGRSNKKIQGNDTIIINNNGNDNDEDGDGVIIKKGGVKVKVGG